MAVQKSRKTPSKRGMHRSHDGLDKPALSVDPQSGVLFDAMDEQLRPAERVRGVELVLAVPGDVQVRVARQRDQGRLSAGGYVHDHDRVGALARGTPGAESLLLGLGQALP